MIIAHTLAHVSCEPSPPSEPVSLMKDFNESFFVNDMTHICWEVSSYTCIPTPLNDWTVYNARAANTCRSRAALLTHMASLSGTISYFPLFSDAGASQNDILWITLSSMERTLLLVSVITLISCVSGQSKVEISRDGGYSNIVIKFDSDVNQHYCAQYIRHLQVRFYSSVFLIPLLLYNTGR